MKKAIYLSALIFTAVSSFAQKAIPSPTENYVFSTVYLNEEKTKKMENIQYFDGLGRPKQDVSVKASVSGLDMVTHIEYDGFGRQSLSYLPLPKSSLNGAIQPVDSSDINSYYGVSNAYSETVFEDSPLNKVKESAFPGEEWKKGTNTLRYEYKANIPQDGVKRFIPSTTWVNGVTHTGFTISSYLANQLFKKEIKDEDGNLTYVFTNTFGQTLLARKINKDPDGTTQNIDTYYIYNEYNQLAYIIPPLAAAKPSLSQEDLEKLCYQYRYDGKGRLVEKKLPGKGYNAASNEWIWDLMVYDKQDRLVALQDANLKLQGNQWLYTQYDQFSRVVSTGICNAQGGTRVAEQTYADTKGSNNTTRNSNLVINYSGMDVYYNVATSYPQIDKVTALYTLNYYDTYPVGTPPVTSPVFNQEILTEDAVNSKISTRSFPTASFVKNIENNGWTKNYLWYDTKGRVIASHTTNHLGGFTKTETELDFVGMPKKTITKNSRKSATTPNVTIEENFTYDDQYRLKKHEHEVVGISLKETLAEYTYNDKEQLLTKKVGGTSTPLQIINYAYNIRGWLTDINDISNMDNGDLFAYKIRYTEKMGLETPNTTYPDYKVKPKYNGNIAEVDWISLNHADQTPPPATDAQRYGYVYDGLNRMKAGFYQNPYNPGKGEYNEIVEEYDLNGNIGKLKRFAHKPKSNFPAKIDDLTYFYDGNQLTKITDAGNSTGYEGGGVPNNYDTNGNMTMMPDKGITGIAYNFLDLPTVINQRGNTTQYVYRADGVKLKRTFSLTNALGTSITNTEYLDGFHYSEASNPKLGKALEEPDDITQSVKTSGEEESYKDEYAAVDRMLPGNPNEEVAISLMFFPTSEGFYDFRKKQYIYQYKDQVGNVRLSYWVHPDEQTLKVLDYNDYYPFGMNISQNSEFSATASPLNYKFQEQELQETGFYSFKWRQYMPDVGRFFGVDPLSEEYSYQSHYNFSENRLTDGREIEGLEFQSLQGFQDYVRSHPGSSFTIDSNEHIVLTAGEKDIEGITFTKKASSGSAPIVNPPGTATMRAIPESTGTALADFRNSELPGGIAGQVVKGVINSGLDAANLIRNINPFSDQRYYDGLGGPAMTNWDGMPLGAQEGLDRSINGYQFFSIFLTGVASAEGSAAKNIWTSTKKMSSVKNAFRHWKDHGAEFPELFNSKQYVERATDFLHNSPVGTLTKMRANGDVLKYHPTTNTFGVMNSSGVPRTMFKPNEGMKYWLGQ